MESVRRSTISVGVGAVFNTLRSSSAHQSGEFDVSAYLPSDMREGKMVLCLSKMVLCLSEMVLCPPAA